MNKRFHYREILLTKLEIGITLTASGSLSLVVFCLLSKGMCGYALEQVVGELIFIAIIFFLINSILVYNFIRLSYMKGRLVHSLPPQKEFESLSNEGRV